MPRIEALIARLMASPVTWGVITLILGGVAFSGRLSQGATTWLLGFAWFAGALGFYLGNPMEMPSAPKRVLATTAFGALFFVGIFLFSTWLGGGRGLRVAPSRRFLPPQAQEIEFPLRLENKSGRDLSDQVLFVQFSPPLPSMPGVSITAPERGPKVVAGGLEHNERSFCFWWWEDGATKCRCRVGFIYDGETVDYSVRVTTALFEKPIEMTAIAGAAEDFPGPALGIADSPTESLVRTIPGQVAALEDRPEGTIAFDKGHGTWCREGGETYWDLFPPYDHGGLSVRFFQFGHKLQFTVRTRYFAGGTVWLPLPRQHNAPELDVHRVAMSWSRTGMALYLDDDVATLGEIEVERSCPPKH